MAAILVDALLPVFLIIALGAVLRRVLLRDEAHWAALERLTFYVLFPALIIVSIAKSDLGEVAVVEVTTALLGAIAIVSAALLGGRVAICRGLALSGPSFTSLLQGSVRWNTYIALAVAGSFAGTAGLAVAAVGIAVIIPAVNVLSVVVLARYAADTDPGLRRILIQLGRNPYVWACAVGIALNALDVPVPTALMSFGDILGRASLSLGLLVVGAGLQLGNLRRPRPVTWLSAGLKLLAMPALGIAIGQMCGVRGVDLLVVAISCAVPSAPNGYVLARQMGGDAPLLAEMLTVQTLLSAVSLPLIIALVGVL
ncbi:AEC family transporter [Ancylobacter terrae]|uniref:AEC family transporter n=1 Tax=Ancylobacter sp. sgz301288 TaxID=3342077 RepID=UPI00385B4E6E